MRSLEDLGHILKYGGSIGDSPATQSIWNITGAVMEERRVEETPPSTWEQALQ